MKFLAFLLLLSAPLQAKTHSVGSTGITSLTGQVTATGPGSAAATIVSAPQSAVNLSTVTTALALKAALAGAAFTGASSFDSNSPVTFSSAVFVGLAMSTIAAGGAGVSVTALCPAGKFATGGGCNCTGGVAVTGTTADFNCLTAGCVPTGFTCQEPGGTGGACSAYVMCSRAQ